MRPPLIRLYEDLDLDGFAGGGGASTGMEMALGVSPAIAINHDPIALAMHEANHPETRHIVSNIRRVRYEREVPAGSRIRVAWFSPDCTHHSKARGGKPFRDPLKARRIRGLAWEAVRCAKALHAATPAGEASRAPRMIVLENVEEWRDWCPMLPDGTPDWSRRGANCRRWEREMAKAGPGYVIEMRELVACDYGDPTKRKRLFIICRSDGQSIVWPEPTHGPGRQHPYRTAAECIDFTLPVPSIFLTQKQAYAWAKKHGLPKSSSPRRPLATATKRRIARGVQRFVLDCPEPFIVNNLTNNVPRPVSEPLATILTGGHKALVQPRVAPLIVNNSETRDDRVYSAAEPIRTLTAEGCRTYQLVTPFLAPYYTERPAEVHARTRGVDEPLPTITTQGGGKVALVVPSLVRIAHGERDSNGKKRGKGEHALTEPLPTITGSNEFALLAPTLINTRNGERKGQAPRVMDIREPFNTITAAGSQGALVAAFLAKHNAGHEATGQQLTKPIDTVTTKDSKALVTAHLEALYTAKSGECRAQDLGEPLRTVTASPRHAVVASHLLKLRGGIEDHQNTSQDLRQPTPTVTAGGTHHAEVRVSLVPKDSLDATHIAGAMKTCAFLVKYFRTGIARPLDQPLDTITTKDRVGLVQVILVRVGDEEWVLVDIGMRMLTPRELFLCQGFPAGYEIERVPVRGMPGLQKLTKKAQTRLVGNSVPPHVAAAIIRANLPGEQLEAIA